MSRLWLLLVVWLEEWGTEGLCFLVWCSCQESVQLVITVYSLLILNVRSPSIKNSSQKEITSAVLKWPSQDTLPTGVCMWPLMVWRVRDIKLEGSCPATPTPPETSYDRTERADTSRVRAVNEFPGAPGLLTNSRGGWSASKARVTKAYCHPTV